MEKKNLNSSLASNQDERDKVFSKDEFMKMFHPYGNVFQAVPSEPIILVQYGIE